MCGPRIVDFLGPTFPVSAINRVLLFAPFSLGYNEQGAVNGQTFINVAHTGERHPGYLEVCVVCPPLQATYTIGKVPIREQCKDGAVSVRRRLRRER